MVVDISSSVQKMLIFSMENKNFLPKDDKIRCAKENNPIIPLS
jgi:hypothetical protein